MTPLSFIPPDPGRNGQPESTAPRSETPEHSQPTPKKTPNRARQHTTKRRRRKPRLFKQTAPNHAKAVRHLLWLLRFLQPFPARHKPATLEIRGRPGIGDQCEVRINKAPIIVLQGRERLVFLVLARFAKWLAAASPADRKSLPLFIRAKVIAEILDKLTTADGPMPGRRWRYPMDVDVHRSIGELRGLLKTNSNLIETGPRPAGYRLSPRINQIILKDAGLPEKYWSAMFNSQLRKRGGSGEADS
ncbi:MAG: hypothetical protein C5B50_02250 [Verrucomicrobia bacterium]|nr:MAG: hypothetical protein C5B50_02250 [Verrucomicrobiota bacterium]